MNPTTVCLLATALLASCSGTGEEPKTATDTSAVTTIAKMAMAAPTNDHHTVQRSFESTSVDKLLPAMYDFPYVYHCSHLAGQGDERWMVYTVIPHAANVQYSLVNEKMENTSTWAVYFQQKATPGLSAGLFVHTLLRIPTMFSGRAVTDVKVYLLDAAGAPLSSVTSGPRKRPAHRRETDGQPVDPNLPTEDVAIYLNAGKVGTDDIVSGLAYVHGLDEVIALTDDLSKNEVTMALSDNGSGPYDFIYFEHTVTAFGGNPVKFYFPDADGDAGTDPRWSMQRW